MSGRFALAALAALIAGSCAAGSAASAPDAQEARDAQSLPPELAALVAQPQTGSFNPEASKDAEFFKDTPERFRPFVAVCNPWDEWDKPAPPFRIHGNTYYVGTCGIAAILIAGDEEHILLDSGTAAGAQVILANIQTLGFSTDDVSYLLHSHEHFDHIGGFSILASHTQARIVSSYSSEAVLTTGEAHRDDPQFGMHAPMEPVLVQRRVATGDSIETLSNGQIEHSVTAIETPGHSPGALSWQWQSCESDDCKMIVYADSLSPVSADDYRFSDHPEYLAAYREGLERLAYLDCDILLTPHPSHSRMLRRMRRGELIEPTACAYYAIGKNQDIERRLAAENETSDGD